MLSARTGGRRDHIVIIGGGPAGCGAGRGVLYGADITVIDSDGIGGACVLWDCNLSKTFIARPASAPRSAGPRTRYQPGDRPHDGGAVADPSAGA